MSLTEGSPLPVVLEALKLYQPTVYINCGPELLDYAEKVKADMISKGILAESPVDRLTDFADEEISIKGEILKYDFVLDLRYPNRDVKGIHQQVRRIAKDKQGEFPSDKVNRRYFRFPATTDAANAIQLSVDFTEKHFYWEGEKGIRDIALEMLKRMEFDGKKPRVSPWESILGDESYLLNRPAAVLGLKFIVTQGNRKVLNEYTHLILVDHNTKDSVGETFELGEGVFDISEGDGKIKVDCSGCSKPRKFIPVPNTSIDTPNGMLVVISHCCEHCGNKFDVTFDPNITLQSVLDDRNS